MIETLQKCVASAFCYLLLAVGIIAQQTPHGNAVGRGSQGAPGERPPVPEAHIDPAAVDRGTQIYRPGCGFCHGADARGAGAPDLARSLVVVTDDNGKEIGEFLKVGRPDKGMPSFAGLTPDQLGDLSAFLHGVVLDARKRRPMDNNTIVVGDAKVGEAYFNGAGKCSTCHSPTGDLKGVAAKYDPAVLQDRMVDPRGGRGGTPPPPATVKVSFVSGQVFSGRLVTVNDFFVTLVDATGNRRTFARDNDVPKVEVNDPLQAHLDMMLKYTDENMHNLTAYLVTLK